MLMTHERHPGHPRVSARCLPQLQRERQVSVPVPREALIDRAGLSEGLSSRGEQIALDRIAYLGRSLLPSTQIRGHRPDRTRDRHLVVLKGRDQRREDVSGWLDREIR